MICPKCGNECIIVKMEERDRSAIREYYFCKNCDVLYGEVQSLPTKAITNE